VREHSFHFLVEALGKPENSCDGNFRRLNNHVVDGFLVARNFVFFWSPISILYFELRPSFATLFIRLKKKPKLGRKFTITYSRISRLLKQANG
jgi:hypothetical protein